MRTITPLKGKTMFPTLTIVFAVVSLFAIAKAAQYKTQIEKIQKSTWAVFDDMDSNKTSTETLDNLMRKIWHALYD